MAASGKPSGLCDRDCRLRDAGPERGGLTAPASAAHSQVGSERTSSAGPRVHRAHSPLRMQSGTLELLSRYLPARRVAAAWRCLEAISAALASTHFLGGLAAAVPNAVAHVKQQRLEEIRAEERKKEMLQERSYSLIVSAIYSIHRDVMRLTNINDVQQ